jgi:hypothetical protein
MNPRGTFMGSVSAVRLERTLSDGTIGIYWVVVPEGMTKEQAVETQEWHGPFKTDDEARENERLINEVIWGGPAGKEPQ